MIHPVNLYLISRVRSEKHFNTVEGHHSHKNEHSKTRYHEVESLRRFVDACYRAGAAISTFDGFFYGYTIPQIGKEFDLLKFSEKFCLNIELKSASVPEAQILDQLLRNRYYLQHLGKRTVLYSVVTDAMTCYKLSMNDELIKTDLTEIQTHLTALSDGYTYDIDSLFKPSKYLVSPLNTPAKFIQGEYFLTQSQEQIKRELLKKADNAFLHMFFHLTGRPGTGKTLLLYDLAKTLSKNGETLVVHCGKLSSGQEQINEEMPSLTIIPASKLRYGTFDLAPYEFILVDETHRIYEKQFIRICESVQSHNQICIFSSDPEQVLSKSERDNNIVSKIQSLDPFYEFVLSEKIRTNKELNSFILNMQDLNHRPKRRMDYSSIKLNYANTTQEAQNILEYYRHKNYVFINFSKSNYGMSPYSVYEEDFDTHHVIGQEFDKVVMLMDDSFYYDDSGILRGRAHPNPDYLYSKLFYQGVTRVRNELAIVVVNDYDLFEKVISIVDQ